VKAPAALVARAALSVVATVAPFGRYSPVVATRVVDGWRAARASPSAKAIAGHQRRAAEPRHEEVEVAKLPWRVYRAVPRHVERLGEVLRRAERFAGALLRVERLGEVLQHAERVGGVPQHAV
jgi:hypothetical protein